jgi:hypothetical protein
MAFKNLPKELEEKILLALYRYYLHDITFEKVAEDAGVPLYFLIKYVNDYNLPIVHTDKDVTDGIKKVLNLMKEKGMDTSKLEIKLPA